MNTAPSAIHRPYPELTWVALVTGWFIGAIIAIAIGLYVLFAVVGGAG